MNEINKTTEEELDEIDKLEQQAAGAFSIPKSEIENWEKRRAERKYKVEGQKLSSD